MLRYFSVVCAHLESKQGMGATLVVGWNVGFKPWREVLCVRCCSSHLAIYRS